MHRKRYADIFQNIFFFILSQLTNVREGMNKIVNSVICTLLHIKSIRAFRKVYKLAISLKDLCSENTSLHFHICYKHLYLRTLLGICPLRNLKFISKKF